MIPNEKGKLERFDITQPSKYQFQLDADIRIFKVIFKRDFELLAFRLTECISVEKKGCHRIDSIANEVYEMCLREILR